MARFIKSKKQAIGISPDSLMFRGEVKTDNVRVRLIEYDSEKLHSKEIEKLSELRACVDSTAISWINIDGLHDERVISELSSLFSIDELVLSDVLNPHNRPKVQEYDDCLYLSIKMLYYDEKETSLKTENLSIILKENLVLTFQERVGDMFDPVRKRLNNAKKRIRQHDAEYLVFALLDVIIDHYIYILSQIGYDIECFDDELIAHPNEENLLIINKYKREVNYMRKVIIPARELISNLVKIETDYISDEVEVHYKELEHNIKMATESVDSYREILSDQLGVFHTNMSNKLNDVLKVLTIFSVIFIPITFIAGIYGTNFEFIPELKFKYGYLYMWILILITVAGMIYYFKRKRWL